MIYLLDTDTCIAFLNGQSDSVVKRIRESSLQSIYLCSIVKAELWFGVQNSQSKKSNAQKLEEFFSYLPSLPFDDSAAKIYGVIRAELKQKGQPIGPNDTLIAATALANQATLVTHNQNEFKRVSKLKLEDWLI